MDYYLLGLGYADLTPADDRWFAFLDEQGLLDDEDGTRTAVESDRADVCGQDPPAVRVVVDPRPGVAQPRRERRPLEEPDTRPRKNVTPVLPTTSRSSSSSTNSSTTAAVPVGGQVILLAVGTPVRADGDQLVDQQLIEGGDVTGPLGGLQGALGVEQLGLACAVRHRGVLPF